VAPDNDFFDSIGPMRPSSPTAEPPAHKCFAEPGSACPLYFRQASWLASQPMIAVLRVKSQ